jgi:hypothetical protein
MYTIVDCYFDQVRSVIDSVEAHDQGHHIRITTIEVTLNLM